MSWMQKLYETYEQGMDLDLPEDQKLMPISHTLQNAHINICIDDNGNFKKATVLEKTQVVLPATEKSAGRSSGEAAHPLADKLQYVAADYGIFGGKKKNYFDSYLVQLQSWCQSEYRHSKANAVRKYVGKRSVIQDLINAKVCFVDAENRLMTSWPEEEAKEQPAPALFKVLPKEEGKLDQGNALVCWTVESKGEPISDTWKDESLQRSWMAFDAENSGSQILCYVSGLQRPAASNHPAKIRHTGDKAKLVSANDSSGFTYRGRFIDGDQVANVAFEVTQKAHNALRWLINRQGIKNGDQVVVAWAVSGESIPSLLEETAAWDLGDYGDETDIADAPSLEPRQDLTTDLGQRFGRALKSYMAGYFNGQIARLKDDESIVIMALDSATPGRMAIIYYRDFMAMDYVQAIERWHAHFAWQQRISKEIVTEGKKPKKEVRWLVSAPSPWNILQAAYGDVVKSNETLKKSLYERLLPCILEGKPLPIDLIRLTVSRASNPNNGERWEWERNVGVACALYRGFHHPERQPDPKKRRTYAMSLDAENRSRDYLYGRLLAVAGNIEELALRIADVNRGTTADRLMQRFSDRPFSTWKIINNQLQPYMQQLQVSRRGFIENRKRDLDEIMSLFNGDEFVNDKALTGEYLLGFHCQRMALRRKKDEQSTDNTQTTLDDAPKGI